MSERPDELAEEPQRGYNEEEEQEAYEREHSSEPPEDADEHREEDRSDGEVTESAAAGADSV